MPRPSPHSQSQMLRTMILINIRHKTFLLIQDKRTGSSVTRAGDGSNTAAVGAPDHHNTNDPDLSISLALLLCSREFVIAISLRLTATALLSPVGY